MFKALAVEKEPSGDPASTQEPDEAQLSEADATEELLGVRPVG